LLTIQHSQEALGLAYVHAVSGQAGVNLAAIRRHDYGIDGTFQHIVLKGTRRVESGFPVDFQLKSTTKWKIEGPDIIYDLESKTYNDLVEREEHATSCILIVLCLPAKQPPAWLESSEDQLVLRHCCYWVQLKGTPTPNDATKRIRIPRTNTLTGQTLQSILAAERSRCIGGKGGL
jgi:hypothetical protein